MRQIVLDTETTGLSPRDGHRVIEIGCVEMVDRCLTGAHFHHYINPDRLIDEGAKRVHGITEEFLADKPRFDDISGEFLSFVDGAELVIHNAPFDIGFLNSELRHIGHDSVNLMTDICEVLDTLALARSRHPGQKNSLDALCQRYQINNAHRTKHGALLDAEILAEVYLAMTGGQMALFGGGVASDNNAEPAVSHDKLNRDKLKLRVVSVDDKALKRHKQYMDNLSE